MRKELLNTVNITTTGLWDGMLYSLVNNNHLPDYTASYPRIMQYAQQDFILTNNIHIMHLKRHYESIKTNKQYRHKVKMKQDRPECGLHLQRLN